MFKSYYVVWKLNENVTQRKVELSFKSYYVVWKQYRTKKIKSGDWSLNRTM